VQGKEGQDCPLFFAAKLHFLAAGDRAQRSQQGERDLSFGIRGATITQGLQGEPGRFEDRLTGT
jgi:hypothetical protein